MPYHPNKVTTRTASLQTVIWSNQKFLSQGLIELNGEYTFDFFNEQDRSRWLGSFSTEKMKREHGDRFFAARELVVRDYIEKAQETQFNKNIVPVSMAESPRSFLYNDLIGRMALEKNFILPALRKTGVFSPITENMERMFFEFDQKSYDIQIIEIPDNYTMRQIFKVTFRVHFNIKKYIDYMIVKKKAKFELHIWPDCYIKMTYSPGWPMIFMQDKINFYNAINNMILDLMCKTPAIINYVYSTIKVRLDRVSGLRIQLDQKSQALMITTDHVMSLFTQFLAGKIDIFNNNRISSSFNIQKIEPAIVQRYGMTGNSSGAVLLMYFYAMHHIAKRNPGTHASQREIERVMKDIKNGKIKISGAK